MHDTDDSERRLRPTAEEDDQVERAVLGHVLHLHPIELTLAELLREMAPAKTGFQGTDAIERAVRELVAVGLLHREGETIRPSRSALRFGELFEIP